MAPTFDPGPNPFGPPPVLLGALGPVMTRTAAEVADGLLVMPFHSHRHFRERTLPAVEEGLARAGRDPAGFAIQPQAILALGDTATEVAQATAGVRRLLAFYGSTPAYRPVLEVEGWADLQPELNALSRRGAVDEMAALVTDDMVDVLAVRGTPAACAAELRRRFGDVAERVCVYFPGSRPGTEQVRALAAAVA
jgi:probable F420-dependent oxidoreductase